MHRVWIVVVLVINLFVAFPVLQVAAQDAATPASGTTETTDWPMYRGDAGRTGSLPGTGPVGDPVLLWQFTAGGSASRAPAIAGGVAYFGGDDGILYALDAMTGAEIWRFDAGEPAEITPTVAGGMVYLNTLGGALIAVDATSGEEVWRFAEPIAADSTPAVVDGLLYAGIEAGNLFAIDAATGEERWRYTATAEFTRSPTVAGGAVFVGTSDGRAYGVDAASGADLWEFIGDSPGDIIGTLTAADGAVYATQTETLYALDAATGEVRWRNAETAGFRPLTVSGGRLYGSGLDNTVYALDATDGAILWSFATGDNIQASPALVAGVLYVASYDGNVYALDAERGAELWRFPIDGELTYGPSVANGVVYASTSNGAVYAIGGTESSSGGAAVSAAPAATDVAADASTPIATESLELLWQSTGGPDPLYSASTVAIAPDGNVWILDAGNNRFQILSPDGEFLEAWDGVKGGGQRFDFTNANGGFDGDIAFDAAGNIYVSEPGAHRVRVFTPDRQLLTSWGEFGTGDGQFTDPIGIAVDREGNVYVLDWQRNDIQKFDGQGNHLATFGGDVLRASSYMGIDPDGNVWVADDERNVVLTGDGEFVREFDSSGSIDVAVGADGTVYEADLFNARIQVYDATGRLLAVWGVGRLPSGEKPRPFAVTPDNQGNLYVVSNGADDKVEANVQKFRLPE